MRAFPLGLRSTPACYGKCAGVLLHGDDPAVWLDLLVRHGLAGPDVRLYVVPRAAGDLRPEGVLVRTADEERVEAIAGGVRYRCIAQRLFLPADAELDPEVDEHELAELLDEGVWLLHPSVGLVAFDAGDELGVADLLQGPPEEATDWGRAHPGLAPELPLTSVVLSEPPAVERIIEEAGKDIGTKPLEDLPPAPGEEQPGWGARGRSWLRRGLARGLLKFTRRVPEKADHDTWVNRLEDWALRTIQRSPRDRDGRRQRAIDRLLEMLGSDLEQALKYAIPLGAGGSRGVSDDGDQLQLRDVGFQLERLRGGERASLWNVDYDRQLALQRAYREAANREIALGRHRRAASIFAELLGDLSSAASALFQGGDFREAAALHERLGNEMEMARCLEAGRLWSEAAAIYERLEVYERLAELYEKLGRTEDARAAWRRAADARLAGGSTLSAARIHERRLDDPDTAFALLRARWPRNADHEACLCECFRLLERTGQRGVALALIDGLCADVDGLGDVVCLARVLAETLQFSTADALRESAAGAIRRLAGDHLDAANKVQTAALVRSLRMSAPEDLLLAGDAARYRDRRRRETPPEPRSSPRARRVHVKQLTPFPLLRTGSGTLQAVRAVSWGRGFFAAILTRHDGLVLVEGDWTGQMSSVALTVGPNVRAVAHELRVAVSPSGELLVGWPHHLYRLKCGGASPLDRVERYAELSLDTRDFDYAGDVLCVVSAHTAGEQLTLSRYKHGLLSTHTLPAFWEGGAVRLCCSPQAGFVSQGTQLWILEHEESISFDDEPVSMFLSAPNTTTRLVLSFPSSAAILTPEDAEPIRFSTPRDPVTCFTRSGFLVAAGRNQVAIYHPRMRWRKATQIEVPDLAPVAVMPTIGMSSFAVFDTAGTVHGFDLEDDR